MKTFKTRCVFFGVLLFTYSTGSSQLSLNWATSYVPVWINGNTSGNAINIGGGSVNCTTAVSISGGSFTLALGGSGAQTPTVSGSTFTVPGSASRLQVTPNFAGNTDFVTIVFTFSAFITNVSFKIADIDKNSPSSNTYFDRVQVTGSDGTNTYNATLSKYDNSNPNFLIISGNTAQVNTTSGMADNTASDATDQRGTVNVSFGSTSLKTITIRYDNAAGAQSNPAAQAIAVGAIGFQMSTLPVTLSKLSALLQSDKALLQWQTETELNSHHFEIEKSIDGITWVNIGLINAAGNSSSVRNYHYTDAHLFYGLNYYRLKIVDGDGRYQFSNVVNVNYTSQKISVIIYPNPVSTNALAEIYSAKNTNLIIQLLNTSGQILQSQQTSIKEGKNQTPVPMPASLVDGIYYLQILNGSGEKIYTGRLIKK